jgi:CysZ protein
MILTCFGRALAQLSDRRLRAILWRSVRWAALVLFVSTLAIFWLITAWFDTSRWFIDLARWGVLAALTLISLVLMLPVASAITSVFLDDVAHSVEARYYPALPDATPMSVVDGLRDTLGFLGVMIAANLLAIIVYLVLPFAAVVIFYAMNGYLLGREYFQLAAARRIGRAAARRLHRDHWLTIWLAGCLMALPLSLPVINLVVPILGAATFTHLYHRCAAEQRA